MASITWINVIDTSVKIGLGALISGISTYFVAKGKFSQDIEKTKYEDSRALLKEIALLQQKAAGNLNDFVHSIVVNKQTDSESTKLLVEAKKSSTHAQALALMLGFEELASSLGNYHNSISTMQDEFIVPEKYNYDNFIKTIEDINDKTGLVHVKITEAYSQ